MTCTARPEARDYLNVVHAVAYELASAAGPGGSEHDHDELVGDGMVALVQATRSFDPSRGMAFMAYLTPRLRWAMLDGLRVWLGRNGAAKPRAGRLPRPEVAIGPGPEDDAMQNLVSTEVRAWLRTLPSDDQEVMVAASKRGGLSRLARKRGVSAATMSHAMNKIRPRARIYFRPEENA